MDREIILVEKRQLRLDIDHYMNTGEIKSEWDDSPHRDDFKAYVDALQKHIPVPCDINEIIELEAIRRLEARGAG